MKLIFSIYIYFKTLWGVLRGWIHPVEEELQFVKKHIKSPIYDDLKKNGMKYMSDLLFGKVQWDRQYDSITAYKTKGDDCDGFNRIVQCWYHLQGYKAYLVTYIADPFEMSHTTCLIEKDGIIKNADYGSEGKAYHDYDFELCIESLAYQRYGARVVRYVVQNINWRLVNFKKIYGDVSV